jgi:phosphoglycerol transferase MdoB-like AlkP superfamily enzyme
MVILVLAVIFLPIILRKRKIFLPFAPSATNILSVEVLLVLGIASYITNSGSSDYMSGGALNLSTNSFSATSVKSNSLNMINTDFSSLVQRIQAYFDGKNWNNISKNESEPANIILVLSESLSMVDSKYAGGLFDRLPMIDKLQQDGMVFKHTVSNGKITPHGLAAFILGIQTTKTGGYAGMMDQFTPEKFPGNNIVSFAKNAGYNTIMVSPGQPISFYQMYDWFKSVGFDQIYTMNSEIFATAPRFTWDAPSDQAMFDAVLNMLPSLKKPYFLVIETVSLHQPYILPDIKYRVGDDDLHNLINYVDGTTSNFYQALKKQHYFNDGYFLIFGDHRRFEPLEQQEKDDGGYAVWHERIVCSIVGKGIPALSVYNGPFSLVDMNALLHYIVNGQPVNEATILQASLSGQLGIDSPFSVSLVDDDHGTYLIRSDQSAPLYISIFGDIPFSKIPSASYRDAVTYLIENDQQMNAKIAGPTLKAKAGF